MSRASDGWRGTAIRDPDRVFDDIHANHWLCVLGGEVAYLLCLFGGMLPLRSTAGTEVHHSLFETLPGFVWITPASVALGAAYVFAFAWIFGSYMVWMHNSSLIEPEVTTEAVKTRKGAA